MQLVARGASLAAFSGLRIEPRETPRHRHREAQLLGATRGLLQVSTSAGQWVVPAVHAVWIPPEEPHALRAFGAFDGWSVYLSTETCDSLGTAPRTLRVSGLLREAVQRASTWQLGARSLEEERLAAVIRDEIAAAPSEALGLHFPTDRRLARVAKALALQPGDGRDASAWAAWAGLSPRTLSRRFSAETGMSFVRWRQHARCLRALERLAEGAPVSAVALEVGYQSLSAFTTVFRTVTGSQPVSAR